MSYKTEQEKFWAGEFGDEYVNRNQAMSCLVSDIHLFSNVFKNIGKVSSLIEFGANIGLNLKAIKTLIPNLHCSAIEINEKACKELCHNADDIFHQSILEFIPKKQYDIVLCKGILIHINPKELPMIYKKIYESSCRYIIICEYYSPNPVMIEYRGNRDCLFKRDFAGELMDLYPTLKLVDYGFSYHRDNHFPQDDTNWFLLEK